MAANVVAKSDAKDNIFPARSCLTTRSTECRATDGDCRAMLGEQAGAGNIN